jgi:eukaryotic-like serine/threonine-protein kinase
MDATEPGHMLSGRYRFTAVLGRGGMGVVWQAHDELLNRDVAVKEILWPPHLTEQEQQIACQRAIREAQMAGRLSHYNVVRIYDIVEEDGHPSIVMELLPYRSLRDIVEQDGPLPPVRAAEVGLGVLAALRAAHQEGILHRDVKPANILVGSDGRVVLTDFGIARAADSPTLTTGGALLGSPSYIAPERAMGGSSGAAGPPGDLWGLGASLYAAVEGQPPFKRNSALATLTAVVADELEEAAHAGPLAPVINGLLRKDPNQRLGADETEEMLRRVAALDASAAVVPPPRAPVLQLPGPRAEQHEGTLPAEAAPAEAPLAGIPAAEAPSAEDPVVEEPASTTAPAAEVPDAGTWPTPPPAAGEPPADAPHAEEAVLNEPPAEAAPGEAQPEAAGPDAPGALARTGASATRDERELPGSPPRRRRRGLLVALAALIVVAAAVTALAFDLTSSPRPASSASAGSTRAAAPSGAAGAVSAAASPSTAVTPAVTSPSPAAATGGPTAQASPSGSAAAVPSGSSAAAGTGVSAVSRILPAGYYRFTNSTGFSIGVPDGWVISHVGHYVYITDPADPNIYLLIDQSDHPNANPLADWQQQAAYRESSYPDYRLIRLASVSYPQAEKAADWEFTYDRDGVLVHILNRNVLANASHAYALYWSAPESDWNAYYHYFETFAATFRPAA